MIPNIDIVYWAKFGTNSVVGRSRSLIFQKLFLPTAEAYVKEFFSNPNTTDSDKARFRSGSFEHAGKWLSTIPRNGFWMNSQEFKIAMKMRLGINDTNNTSLCSCGRALANDYQHLLTCHLGNQIINRHTALVNYFCDLLNSADQTVVKEVLLTENQNMESNLRSDFTTKRYDLVSGAHRHQHYDVTVTNPSNISYTKEVKSHLINGAAARRAHQLKIRKYSNSIDQRDFHPLVFETFGYWRPEVTNLVRVCCLKMEETSNIAFSVLIGYPSFLLHCSGRMR